MAVSLWILIFVFALALLVKSSDWVVEGASQVGRHFRLPPFVIGILLVGSGTSLPELSSSLAAVLSHQTGIVTANIIGSNIANILLVLGAALLLSRGIQIKRKVVYIDSIILLGVSLVFLFMAKDGKISLLEGIILLVSALGYLFYNLSQKEKKLPLAPKHILDKKDVGKLIVGLGGLALGAEYTIRSLVHVATGLGVSNAVMAVTALAIGTSLPELAVSIRGALAKKYDLIVGNIIGSNVFNILLVIGLSSLVHSLSVSPLMVKVGLPFLAIATFLFIFSGDTALFSHLRIAAWQGAIYLSLYLIFLGKVAKLF